MADSGPMRCPACGAEMNHHADKVVYEGPTDLEGRLEELHACPACGMGASRPAAGVATRA